MKIIAIAGCVFLAVMLGAAAPAFKPVTIDLPPDSAHYPDGPKVKTVSQNCLACHSADMVLDQPLLPRATWAAEVTKMRNVYKAPISDADAALIVDYLSATHAPP